MSRPLLGAVLATLLLFSPAPARSHEPLWGETPTVFGFGVIHPEVRWGFRDAGSARRGVRARTWEAKTMFQYAPSTALNLMLELPWMQMEREARVNGRRRRVVIGGLGDLELTAKRRFSVRQTEGVSLQHSLVYGLKLPTGESRLRDVGGRRADAHDQPGSGKPGLVLGYAWDRETVADTVWASTRFRMDLGGGYRMGEMLDLDVAYGHWLKRANEASELGFNLALGVHGELHMADRGDGGRSAGNGSRLLGLQLTPILTKDNHQLRVGVFVPFVRKGPADQVAFPYELRVAFETFF